MTISYTIENRTTLVQEVEAKMGQSEAFMYSGNRQVRDVGNGEEKGELIKTCNFSLIVKVHPL